MTDLLFLFRTPGPPAGGGALTLFEIASGRDRSEGAEPELTSPGSFVPALVEALSRFLSEFRENTLIFFDKRRKKFGVPLNKVD
jgi:hypothetical protein